MDNSVNGPQQMGNLIIEEVWYEGTDSLKQGEAVCYNTDVGTATVFNGKRCNRVERPSSSNNNAFAGVVERTYSAKPAGQRIRIAVPGSKGALVALGADTTINSGILTFTVGGGSAAGRFVKAGFPGRGSIVPRQTVTAVVESSMTGAWSLATDGVTLTVSDTTGLAAGDTVVLLGGKDEGSSKAIVAGKYSIASITSSTVLVLSSSAVGSTPAGALTCTGYAYVGNPMCQADLLEGEESGGVQFVSCPAAGGAASVAIMVGGVTYVLGGLTLAAHAQTTLADGTIFGAKKAFWGLGTMTTNDAVVNVTTGVQMDGTTALASVSIDAAAERAFLVWYGHWKLIAYAGATLA